MARVEIPLVVLHPDTGAFVEGAEITVKHRGAGTVADIFAAESGGTALVQPVSTDAQGRIQAWVERGAYDIEINITSQPLTTEPFDATPGGDGTMDADWMPAAIVTTSKIANDAVTADKLKDDATGIAGAVTSDHIRDDAVTSAKVAPSAVGSGEIADLAVTEGKIGTKAVTSGKLGDQSVVVGKLSQDLQEEFGLNSETSVRRGVTSIATEETTTSTSFTTLTTADEVASVVLPTDGLLFVSFRALWKLTGASNVANAAIFLNGNQLKVPAQDSAPVVSEASLSHTGDNYGIVYTAGARPSSTASTTADSSFVTTGSALGGSEQPTCIEAATGTYTVSVRYKVNATSGGTLSVKERKLRVWTMSF